MEKAQQGFIVTWPKREDILEEDHYGLEKVKERILEYLAVQQRVKKLKGPILCLVGPPGVGKTSLGKIYRACNQSQSLLACRWAAFAMKPKFAAIGAPISARCRAKSFRTWQDGVRNPLFLLDEVDKMAMDFRGDPHQHC